MKFDFGVTMKEQQWWIKDVLPKGAIVGVIAQSAAGKSTFTNGMLMHLIYGIDFIGKKTENCDVLIIDQDSQRDGYVMRLRKLNNKLLTIDDATKELHEEWYQNLHFKDGSLYNAINKYPQCKVILIDAYHKVGGDGFNYDKITDAATAFEKLTNLCMTKENSDRTIIITHHGTEKTDENMTADEYMTTESFSKIAMGSSAFIESMDCYYILSSPNRGNLLKHIYLRPKSKRVMLPDDPFIVCVEQGNYDMDLSWGGLWKEPEPEIDKDIMLYFKENKENTHSGIKDINEHLNHLYPEQTIREACRRLERQGKLIKEVKKANMFAYHLPDASTEPIVEMCNEK